ncbi:MAG: hypothetical protein Kow00114_23890 [Kiloniellaceae bacterium]
MKVAPFRRFRLCFLLAGLLPLAGCGVQELADEVVCTTSYCASQEEGRYIDHLTFDAADYEPEPDLQSENLRLVRAVNKGILRHDPLQSYAQGVLDRIVAAAPVPSARPRLAIAANASLNAQSLPGGLIVIHHSLFEYLKNEEQLAFILSHEYSHYLLDHFSFFDRARAYVLTAAETAMMLEASGNDEELRRMLQVYGSDILVRDLIYPSWARRKEDEADRLGVDLMVRAGYNPAGAQEYLETLAAYEEQLGRHAEIELNRLEREVYAEHGGEAPATPVDPSTGALDPVGFLVKNGLTALREMQQEVAARHAAAVERAAAVVAYIERDYEDESFRDRPGGDWASAIADSRQTRAAYTAAAEVIATLESREAEASDLAGLEAKARQAVSGATEGDSYTRLAFFKLRKAQNRLQLAERNLDIALESDPAPSFQVVRAKADLLARRGERKAAFDLLEQNAETYEWPFQAYIMMIRLADAAGQGGRRGELVVDCAFKYPQSQYACRTTR